MGFLPGAFRPATIEIRRLALELRPHRARLLSASLHGIGCGEVDSRAATFQLYADGLLAGDLSPRDTDAPPGKADQPVPAHSAPVSPPGQPLDAGRDSARSQPQSAIRSGAV